jgi:hypothetical protein
LQLSEAVGIHAESQTERNTTRVIVVMRASCLERGSDGQRRMARLRWMHRSMLCEPPLTHPTKVGAVQRPRDTEDTHECGDDENADDEQHGCPPSIGRNVQNYPDRSRHPGLYGSAQPSACINLIRDERESRKRAVMPRMSACLEQAVCASWPPRRQSCAFWNSYLCHRHVTFHHAT